MNKTPEKTSGDLADVSSAVAKYMRPTKNVPQPYVFPEIYGLVMHLIYTNFMTVLKESNKVLFEFHYGNGFR
ncbi:MAG TPA: hypothetical protein VGO47_05290 [Chlamydiales bacterium]|jgi:hypothetical protein|nr:hypothetical protein [Chlamydiales bacterium]